MSSQPPTYTFEVKSNGVSISTNLTQVTRKSKGSSNITYVTPTYSFLPSTKTKETGAYPPVVATNSAVYQLAEDNIPFRYVDPTDNITKTLKVSRNSTSPTDTDTTIKWEGDWLSLFPDGFAVLSPQQSTADGTDTITFTVRNKLNSVYNLNMQTPFLWLYQGSGNESTASYTKYDANGAKVGNEYILEKNTAEKLSENQANYITKTIIEDIAVGGYIEFTLKRKAVSINNTYLLVSFTGLTCVRPNLSFNYMDAGNKSITSTIGTLASNPIIVSLSTNIRGDPIDGKITYTNNSSFTGEMAVTNNKATITTTALGITSIEINFNFVSDTLLLYTNNLLDTNKLTYNVTSQTLITNVTLENTLNRAELTSQKLSSSTETENDSTKRVRVAYNDTLKMTVKFVDSNNVVYPNVLNSFKIHVNDLEIATISTYTPEIGYTYSLDIAYIDRTQNNFSLLKTDSITRHKISLKNVTATNSTAYIVTSQTDVYFDILPVKFKVDVKNTNSGTQNTFSYGSTFRLISYPVTDMAFAPSAPQAPSGLSSELYLLMTNIYTNGFKIKDPTNQNLIYQFYTFTYEPTAQYFYADISMAEYPIEVNASQYYVQSLLKIIDGVATYQSDNTQLFTVQKQATTLEILYLTTDNKTSREYNSPFEIEIKMTGLVNPTNENLNERSGRFSLYKIESNTETEVLNAVNNVYILNSGNSSGNIRVNIDAPTVIGVNLSQSGNFRLYFKDDEYVTSYDDFTLIGDKEYANVHVSTAKETDVFDMSEDIVFNVNTYVTTGTTGLNQKIEGYYKAPGFEYMLFQTINNTTTGLSQNTDFTFTPLNNPHTEQGVYSFRFVMTITSEDEKHKYSIGERIYSPVTINKKQISFTSVLKYIGSTEEFITSSNGNTPIPYTQESRFEITLNPPIAASFSIKYENLDTPILTGTSGVDGKFTSAKFTPEGEYFLPGDRLMRITITPNNTHHYQGISLEAHKFVIGGITDKGFKSIALTKSTLTYLEPIKISLSFVPLTGGAVFKGNLRIIGNNNTVLVSTQELSFLTQDIQTIEFPTVSDKIINARFLGLNAREAVHSIKISFLPVGENNTASIYSEIIQHLDLTVVKETITLGLTAPTTAVYGQPINVSVIPSWEAAGDIHLYIDDSYIDETKIGSIRTYTQPSVVPPLDIAGNFPSILDLDITGTKTYTLSVKFVSTDANFNSVDVSETKTINISRAIVKFQSLLINETSYTTYLDNGITLSIVDETLTFSGKLTTQYTPVKSGSVRLQNGQYNSPLVEVNNTGDFSVTVPISTITFKQSGNVALFYTNTSKFAEREFKTSDDDDIPGVVFLTVNYIPCTINFTKTQTTTDWHDGSFTFKAILNAAVYPSFTVDDAKDGKTVMKIYDKQTSTLKLTKTFTYSELKNDSAGNASWTINPKTESLNAADYYITCEFAGIPYFYEDTDANDILFTVTKTVPKIKLQISDDKTFNVSKSYSSMTVIYKQQTYLALTIKTDNTINNANGDNILGISSFTYSGPASNTVALNNNVDTPEATSHGIVQNVNQIKDTINQKVISLPNTYDASATTYQIRCDFAPQYTENYTTSFAVVTLKINKYTPVIDTSVISEYLPSTDATNLVNAPVIAGKITYNEQYTVKNKFINSVPYEFETINYGAIGGTINYKYLSKDAAPSSVNIYSLNDTGTYGTKTALNAFGFVDNQTEIFTSLQRNTEYIITLVNTTLPYFVYRFQIRVAGSGDYLGSLTDITSINKTTSFRLSDYNFSDNQVIYIDIERVYGFNPSLIEKRQFYISISNNMSYWHNNNKSDALSIKSAFSMPAATPLTIENQGLASIEASTALNAYTYTAIGNAQKINANNDIGYRMFVNFTPSDTVNFNAAVEKVEDFNIYTANALGTVDIDLDTTSASNNLVMTFDQKESVDINANIVFNSNVLASDRKGSLKFYKDGSDENNNGILINSEISIDESGTTKNPYKTNVSTTITSHPIFTASYYPYFIYATLTPTNTTNYPAIKAAVSRSLTIDPRIVLSTTNTANETTGDYEIEFSKEFNIKATIHSGNLDNSLSGTVTFKFIDKNDSQKEVITHQVNITKGANGNPAYAEFTTLRTNIASRLVPSSYTIKCDVAFNNNAYRPKSDDGKNVVLFVKPQPVSFKLKLIDDVMIATADTSINNFLYKSLNPKIVSTFYAPNGANPNVYGGTITYTITNIATSVQTVYVVTNTNTLEEEANVYTFQIPTGTDGEPVLAVGDYSITAEYDSPNFGTYTNKNMELYGTELLYSVNKNSTSVGLSNNSKPYVVGLSSQSLTLSAKVTTIYGEKISGNLDRVRFTIFEDNFNDATTSPVLVVINASYSSLDDAFKTTAINTLLSGTYRVMVQFTGNDSYNPSDPVYTSIIIPSLFETVANHNYAVTLDGTNYKFTVPNKSGDTVYLYMNKQLAPFENVTSLADDSVISVADSTFLTGNNIVYAVVLTKNKNKQIVYNTVTVNKPKLLITNIVVTSDKQTVAHKSAVTLSVVVTSNRPSVQVNEGQLVYTIDGTIVGYSSMLNDGTSSFTRQLFMNETATANISVSFLSSTNYDANSIVGTTSVAITKVDPPLCSLTVDSTTVKYLDKKTITLDLGDQYINGITDSATATFYDNGQIIFDNVQVLNGKATVELIFDKLVDNVITAKFNGNRNYNNKISTNSLEFIPTKDTIANKYTSITSSTSLANGFITMTVTAVPISTITRSNLLLNTGSVTFKRSDMVDIVVQLHNGQASVCLPNTTALTFTFSHPYLT
jgi:hypothetical protein